jgi:ABC-type transport system involved in multi-copper enzyme maturation permease subunit
MMVSALALDAFIIAGVLAGIAVAREFESGTARLLSVSPVSPLVPIMGRLAAASATACVAMAIPFGVVVFGYRVHPEHPVMAVASLAACTLVFGCAGVMVGALVRRTLPVAFLMLGLAMPLYICSGALEPERFDGERLWIAAHFSPLYSAIGVLQSAFHGFRVTPESIGADVAQLLAWALFSACVAGIFLRRRLA